MSDDDFHPWRWIGWFFAIITVLYIGGVIWGVLSLPFTAVHNATTVARRIMDPDTALMNYRYFHDADARLRALPAQISAAEDNLHYAEQHAPDNAENRMTELTGIKQVCQGLVEDYNARAQRIDSGFFRNPERWLPVAASPWTPLPESYDLSICKGESK